MSFQIKGMKGRIDSTEFHGQTQITCITTPAPDIYSKPSTYKLRSQGPIGQVGAEIVVDILGSGYVRNKPYKDKETGQQKVYLEDNVFFDVISAKQV